MERAYVCEVVVQHNVECALGSDFMALDNVFQKDVGHILSQLFLLVLNRI